MAHLSFQVAGLRRQGCRIGVQIDEDKTAELFDLNLVEANVAGIEILKVLGVRRAGQLAVQLVNPRMIGAHDPAGIAFARQQFMCTVLADIVKRAQLIFFVTHDGDGLSGDFDSYKGSRFPRFFNMANPLPRFGKNGFQISVKPFVLRVSVSPQRA